MWFFLRKLFRRLLGQRTLNLPATGRGHKAFLVGINAYRTSPLYGCVNDVKMIKKILIVHFGLKSSDILVLLDKDATTENIMDGLRWLASGALPGDRRFHHFSGHGTQYPNANEADGLSEVIVPVDFDWTPNKMITDKAYYSILAPMPKGVLLNWVSDSCHSGDLQRSMRHMSLFASLGMTPTPERARFLKPPHEIMAKLGRRTHRRTRLARAATAGKLDVGFVSACRSNQTASDTEINGKPCGALSHFLYTELTSQPQSTPLDEIVKKVRKDLAKAGYSQVPQVEGTRAGKPFLMA